MIRAPAAVTRSSRIGDPPSSVRPASLRRVLASRRSAVHSGMPSVTILLVGATAVAPVGAEPRVSSTPSQTQRCDMTVTETTPDTALPESAELRADDVAETPADEVVDEVLVEEISIDGMCGVY